MAETVLLSHCPAAGVGKLDKSGLLPSDHRSENARTLWRGFNIKDFPALFRCRFEAKLCDPTVGET